MAIRRTDEDELCAIHLRNRIEGRVGDGDATRCLILAGGEVARFHDPDRPYLHPEDVDIALDIDCYDFAVSRVRQRATGRSYGKASATSGNG
jgi:2-phosphosulfolactate phosphatase